MKKLGKRILTAGVCAALALGTLTGCSSAKKSDVVATMGDQKITLGLANCMLRFNQATTETYLGGLFGTDNIWAQDMTGSGKAYGETFKEQMMETIKDMLLLESHMADYDVEITADEQAAIEAVAKQFVEANDKKVLDGMMADEETVARMLTLYTVQSKMRTAIEAGVDTEVSDEEAAEKTIQYAFFTTGTYNDEDGNEVERTDEEKEEIKQQAQSIIDEVKGGKTLEDAVKAADENKNVSTTSYGTDDTSLIEVLKTAAETLKEDGEIYAEPVQAETGYYVVQMKSLFDQEATDKHKEEIIEDRKSDLYDETLAGWEPENFEINAKVWEKVTFDDKFTVWQEPQTEAETTEAAEDVTEAETTEAAEETEAETTEAAEETEAETTEAAE